MKVIVSQYGAQKEYAVPQIMEKNHILEALYTDTTRYSFLGKAIQMLPFLFKKKIMKLRERDPNIGKEKIYSSDFLFFKGLFRSDKSEYDKIKNIFRGLSRIFIRWGTKNATCLYNMCFENIEFVSYCKKNGLIVISDIYENPSTYRLLLDEIESTPEYWHLKGYIAKYSDYHRLRMKYIERLLDTTDKYIVPSKYVLDELKKFSNFSPEKAVIIPHELSLKPKFSNKPVKGRIICIGGDSIRKGLVYCQRAAEVLMAKYDFVDFRIINETDPSFTQSIYFDALNFVGNLTKEELDDEYRKADVFVFPTLSEGFESSIYAAASQGCPIVTTERSGVNKGFPGIIVPLKNHEEIVNEVSRIIEDRDHRNRLSWELFEYSKTISIESVEKRILSLLKSLT